MTATSDQDVVLKPGIHYGLSEADYNSIPLVRMSQLLWGKISMRHMREALDGRMGMESEALQFGSAMHCRLLEPDAFKSRYVISKPCAGLLKSGDRKGQRCGKSSSAALNGEWFCGVHTPVGAVEPEHYISTEDANAMERIADKIKAHPVVRLLRQHGGHEATVIWESQNLRLKSRLDKLVTQGHPVIIDLKKIRVGHGTREAFSKSILNYDYHIRAAAYVDAVKQQTGLDCKFIWVCIEDSPPHDIAVYEADEWDIKIGRFEYRNLVSEHNQCLIAGEWPGYSNDITPISLPEWYVKRFESFELK